MKRAFLYISIVFSIFSCKPKDSFKKTTSFDALKDSLSYELREIHQQGGFYGFGVAIVNQDSTLYAEGFGYSALDTERPYTKNTLQNIASVSKTLIGISLLKAQEMGKLKISDPVNQHLPFEVINPLHPKDTITIQHLATHTSSIQDGDLYGQKSYILKHSEDLERAKSMPSAEEFNTPAADIAMDVFLKNFLSTEGEWYQDANFLKSRPGQFYEYTNVGATLAAYIIEVTTGMSYADFTETHILKPLKLDASGWTTSAIDTANLTQLFTVDGQQIPDYKLITYPDGGLITSVDDKAKYLSELIKGYAGNGTLLTSKSYEQFFTEFLSEKNFEEERDTDRPFDDEYNSGLFIGHSPIGYIGHMGGDPGVSTFMFFNPKTKVGKLFFVNTDLDSKGAKQFYAVWDKLAEYEEKLQKQVIK
ncbi:serine hydrolase domain-containing protein [uncultured Croceitalea sp.]|uniref:serine hydrolase domain-containing protein n=1 Tax=uncultured Croceitalea sp. TaxID=1798908 RepID=UPI003305AB99